MVAVVKDVRRSLERRVAPYVVRPQDRREAQPDDARAVQGLFATIDDLSRDEPVEPSRVIAAWLLLAAEVPVVLSMVGSGKTTEAARFLTSIWKATESGASHFRELAVQAVNASPALAKTASDWDRILTQVATFQAELVGRLRELERSDRARLGIPLLMKTLDFSYDEAGRLFGVSGETVRRWADGSVRVPPEQLAKIDEAIASLQRLVRVLKPGRLGEVIRRPAEVFRGEPAINWILAGRIREVAEIYERMLTYQ